MRTHLKPRIISALEAPHEHCGMGPGVDWPKEAIDKTSGRFGGLDMRSGAGFKIHFEARQKGIPDRRKPRFAGCIPRPGGPSGECRICPKGCRPVPEISGIFLERFSTLHGGSGIPYVPSLNTNPRNSYVDRIRAGEGIPYYTCYRAYTRIRNPT